MALGHVRSLLRVEQVGVAKAKVSGDRSAQRQIGEIGVGRRLRTG